MRTARQALASGDTASAVSRAYHGIYAAMQAALEFRGITQPSTHSGMISIFSRSFVKDGPLPRTITTVAAEARRAR